MHAIKIPLPHGGGDQFPTRVIVHAMAEYIDLDAQTAARFGLEAGPLHALLFLQAARLSAHALVTPSGSVLLTREDTHQAWHARGHNQNTLGVEFLVPGAHNYSSFLDAIKSDYVTDEAYNAGLELVREWTDAFDIREVTTHRDVDPKRKQDPGDGFPFDRFVADL